MNKVLTIALMLALVASSLIMVQTSSAQSIPKPSVPEFSVQIADRSYDVAQTTTSYTDPYTGKTTTQVQPGYHVVNRTIEVKIKNQPFNSFTDSSGNKISLYYNISTKPHYGGDWTYYTTPSGQTWGQAFPASNSQYTMLEFGFGGYGEAASQQIGYVTPGGEVDFRVQAQIGYYHYEWVSLGGSDHPLLGGLVPRFAGQVSEWSNPETVKIPETSDYLSPTPSVPELPWMAIVPLFVFVPLIATVLLRKKRMQT